MKERGAIVYVIANALAIANANNQSSNPFIIIIVAMITSFIRFFFQFHISRICSSK
jgi:hypothetical protein